MSELQCWLKEGGLCWAGRVCVSKATVATRRSLAPAAVTKLSLSLYLYFSLYVPSMLYGFPDDHHC